MITLTLIAWAVASYWYGLEIMKSGLGPYQFFMWLLSPILVPFIFLMLLIMG